MKTTKIEWCDSTWNPVTGCLHGCEYCYARGITHRFRGFEPRCGGEDIPDDKKKHGKNSIWNTTHNETLHIFSKQPMRRTKSGGFQKANYPYDFDPTFHRYRLNEPQRWKKPRNIFVCSMADLFGEWVPDEWIQEVFEACEAAPQHNYLFLTKNPKRYRELYDKKTLPYSDNFWFGSTITNPEDEWVWFTNTPYKAFISVEPLLEPLVENIVDAVDLDGISFVIIGAETGNRKNKVIPKAEWVSEIVSTADRVHIPVFMKDSLIPIVGEENMRREFPFG